MYLIPKVMSTQHPDNATPAPFADDAGVLKAEGEVDEAASVYAMGCDEQMWDSEGKEADNQVVRKLLTGYPDLFQNQFQLGRDIALTLRVPNPHIEHDMRKSMVEALAERAIGLGHGARLLRRQTRCSHPGGHPPDDHVCRRDFSG